MYKIIGADSKEYGPADLEELRKWAAEGRLDGRILVKAEGDVQWMPLGSVPELAGLLPCRGGRRGGGCTPRLPAARRARKPFLRAVQAPAAGLFVAAGLNLLCYAAILAASRAAMLGQLKFPAMGDPAADRQMTELMELLEKGSHAYFGWQGLVRGLLFVTASGLIIVAAWKMRRLQNYWLAVTGAVCVLCLPWLSPGCCLGFPFAIWALMVLFKPDVRSTFH